MSEKDNIPRCMEIANSVIGLSDRVLLYGVPGTGKSYQATLHNLGAGQSVYTTTLTEDSSAMELRGHYVPNSKNGMDWHHGTAVQSWVDGARFVINEIDHAGGDVLTFLHSVLDDKEFAGMTLPNKKQEFVSPNENFNVVATMNGTPDMLPIALRDRFPVAINIDSIHPDALKQLPKKYRQVASDMSTIGDTDRRTSIRKWNEFVMLSKELGKEMAMEGVFGDKAEDIEDALESAKLLGNE